MDQLANFLQAVGYHSVVVHPFLPVYLHLLISALFPIYAGAHASLSRPSSAAKPSKKTNRQIHQNDEPEEQEQTMERFDPIDALLLPLLAGLSLASLYFLIKWLEDPRILNLILNWYLAVFGVWSLAGMINDTMGLITSFISPKIDDMDGNKGEIDAKKRKSRPTSSPSVEGGSAEPEPSFTQSLPSKVIAAVGVFRKLPLPQLDVRVYIYKTVEAKFKIGLQWVFSVFVAVAALLYFNLMGKPWWLTNLLGFGFAYSALQVMSPTTSWTGTLIMGALFLYDIYFVFFTPLMVTVATQLDIPAKLLFPRPRSPTEDPTKPALAMLGLGDIVLPGMMIGFALRFDLYLFYLRKQTRRTIKQSSSKDEVDDSDVVKATWYPATGGWGERFWSSKNDILRSKQFQGVLFPKRYFRASVIGYFLGMLCSIGVMEIYGQAQPALLYLVPGVLGSLWGTALVKGDIKALWNFDEAEEEKEKEKEKKNEAERKTETEESAGKADRWVGINWKSILPTIQRTLNGSEQPKDIIPNDEVSERATNGKPKTPEKTRSTEGLSESSKRYSLSHGELTRAPSGECEPQDSKNSQATDEGRKKDKAKGAFHRDRKSELIFISINLEPAKPSKMASTC